MTLIKSISGIRGTIGGSCGESLTPLDIVKFVSAYSAMLHRSKGDRRLKVVVGRDRRVAVSKELGQNPSLKEETSQSSSPAAMSPASSVKSTKTHTVLKRVRHHPSP